jgi:transposase
MEACAGSHYRAREIGKLGHTVRLISIWRGFILAQREWTRAAYASWDHGNILPQFA